MLSSSTRIACALSLFVAARITLIGFGQRSEAFRCPPETYAEVNAMGAYACSKASRAKDKNAGSVFEQRKALARLRAHLRDEVRNRPR